MRNALKGWSIALALAFVVTASVSSAAVRAVEPSQATYDDAVAFIHGLAAQHPQTTKLFVLGDSDSGRKIEGIQVGNGPVNNLLVSTHHGNEYGATEVGKAFAQSVSENPIPGQTLWVIPVLNVDGYNAKDRYEPAQGQSWDPNRDYPGPCGTEGPHKLKDTAALAQFIADKNIVASATLHTFSPAVAYPWGMETQDTTPPYEDIFKMLTQAAAVESQYPTGNSTQLIYGANGTYEDYAFWKHGIWSILFELGDTHTPDDSQVAQLIQVNVPGLRRMFQKAPAQRAQNHTFTGQCDSGSRFSLIRRDRHDE